jgi:hypothetical protein
MTENLVAHVRCLFGLVEAASCPYSSSNPPVYFSLGEAISAFGLIFAVYQLRRPSWDMVLSIRPFWQRQAVWYLSALGLIAILLAAVNSQIPGAWLHAPFNVPLFFEALGFAFFVAAPLSLLLVGTIRVALYNSDSAERFYQVLLREVARGRPETVDAVIDIVGSNLTEVCASLKKLTLSGRPVASEEARFAAYSSAVFDVIVGDARVANHIATARLDFLLYLVGEIKRHRLTQRHFRVGIASLFRALFENPRSHLYAQLERSGLTLSANLYDALFADIELVNSLSPFGNWNTWSLYSRRRDQRYLTVYLEAMEKATESYWRQPELQNNARSIVDGFSQLDEYMRSAWMRSSRKGFDKNVLHSLAFFFGHTLSWAFQRAADEKLVSKSELEAAKHTEWAKTVSYAYAESLYNFFELLGALDLSEDTLRIYALSSSEHILGLRASMGDTHDGIRNVFLELLWQKIDDNARGLYPVVLRILILVVGMKIGDETSVHGLQRRRVIEFLETTIKPRLLAGEKMANKVPMEKVLLSTYVEYNRVTGKFEYRTASDRQVMEAW